MSRNRLSEWIDRHRKLDVVFYTPGIGSLLTPGAGPSSGGAETQVLLLSRALAARGLRVAVVAFALEGLPARAHGVEVIARPPYRRRRGLLGKPAEVLSIWRALWRAPSRAIVRRGASIDLPLIGLFARLTGTRFLFASASVVDFDYAQIDSSRRNAMLYRLGVRLASTIIVQSEEQAAMCRRYFGREPVLIKSLANPVTGSEITPTAFLWIGRIVAYKRPLAYADLARSMPHARFQMVAVPTPHGEEGERLVAELHSAATELENLELLAPRPHAALMELVEQAVAVVSTSDFEGMPNTFLEAWSRGVPVMALSHDPNGVITRHRVGAFAHGSADTLRQQAEGLWSERGSRAEASGRCRDYISDEHSAETIAGKWANELERSDQATRGPNAARRENELRCVA